MHYWFIKKGDIIILTQKQTYSLLKKNNISYAKHIISNSFDMLYKFASKNFPVVLKPAVNEIVHKTELSMVITNITSKSGLKKAYNSLTKKIQGLGFKPNFIVQEQLNGREIIIGMKKDSQFGHVIMFGLGGIFVEVMKDVSFRITPLTKKDAKDMIKEIKAYKILEGIRNTEKANIEKIQDLLLNLSNMSKHNKNITELDFNPVIVNSKTAKVVDARIFIQSANGDSI